MELAISVTDKPDDPAYLVIAEGLGGYNIDKGGVANFRPLAVVVSDPATGAAVGGLYGRTSFGLLFVERFFLPADLRGNGLGGRVLAAAEAEARQRGCTRAALFTLTFQAPGFYLKQGYEAAARLDCDPPGATRMLMTKKLA